MLSPFNTQLEAVLLEAAIAAAALAKPNLAPSIGYTSIGSAVKLIKADEMFPEMYSK